VLELGKIFFIEIRFNSPTSHFVLNFDHVDFFRRPGCTLASFFLSN